MKSIHYNACLAITGDTRGTSEEKIYQELGLESLQLCRWFIALCSFCKVFENEHPKYLFNPILHHMLQQLRAIFPLLRQSITFSKILFFPSTIIEWNDLDLSLRNSKRI